MTTNQTAKADRFKALHQGPRAFLIANAWDAGSARILSALGFQALATSSGASAAPASAVGISARRLSPRPSSRGRP